MKRTTFISVLLAMVFVATAAYAYWTFSTTVSANAIGTGDLKLETWGGPITAAGLVPGGPANVTYMAVKNTGDVPAMVKGVVANYGGNSEISPFIHVKVTLNPGSGPYSFPAGSIFNEGWSGTVANCGLDGLTNLANTPLTNVNDAAMPVGSGAVYKIEVSLDAAADNTTKNKSMTCDFVWTAGQAGDPAFAAY